MNIAKEKKYINNYINDLVFDKMTFLCEHFHKLYLLKKPVERDLLLHLLKNYMSKEFKKVLQHRKRLVVVDSYYIKKEYLIWLVDTKDTKKLKELSNKEFDFTFNENYIFRYIAEENKHHVLKFFLDNSIINVAFNNQYLFNTACTKGYSKIIKLLINNKGIFINNFEVMFKLVINDYKDCIKLIMKDNRFKPTIYNFIAIESICHRKLEIIKIITQEKPTDNVLHLLSTAASVKSYAIFRYLLELNIEIVKNYYINGFLIDAVIAKDNKIFMILFNHYQLDPKTNKDLILSAFENSNIFILNRLMERLKESDIDDQNNLILRTVYYYVKPLGKKYFYEKLTLNKYVNYANNSYYFKKITINNDVPQEDIETLKDYDLYQTPHSLISQSIKNRNYLIFEELCCYMNVVLVINLYDLRDCIESVFENDDNKRTYKKFIGALEYFKNYSPYNESEFEDYQTDSDQHFDQF